jgi:hypothetical protein
MDFYYRMNIKSINFKEGVNLTSCEDQIHYKFFPSNGHYSVAIFGFKGRVYDEGARVVS